MYQRKNFAYGKVLTAPSPADSGTSVVLETGQGARFPNTSGGTYMCVVKQVSLPATPDISEVVLVTSHDPANDTFTITRTQESSSARTVVVGDEFYLAPTKGVWDQIDVSTTKGDLIAFSTAYERLPVGTNDYILTADSTATPGIAWKATGAVSIVRGETPTGSINGSNTSFTLANTPVTGTVRLYQNGIRLNAGGNDYSISGLTITMVTAPATSDVLLADYETNAGTYASGSASFVDHETPTGSINSSNTSFTLAFTPVTGTVKLYRDGQLLTYTGDYTISGTTITMVAAPLTGSVLLAFYEKSVSTAGNADLVDGYHASSTPTASNIPVLDSNKKLPATAFGNIYRARAYRSTNQSVGGSGWTKIQLNAESYDSNNNFDSATNYRYTAPVAGYYQISASINVTAFTGRVVVGVFKNGSEVSRGFDFTSSSSLDFGGSNSDILLLAAGDYIELYGYFSGAVTVSGNSLQTFLAIHLISD